MPLVAANTISIICGTIFHYLLTSRLVFRVKIHRRSLRIYFGTFFLNLLIANKGRVFSIDEIYEKVWNEESFNVENTVAVHIRRIREKIEINPKEPRYLKVVWGVGYKIEKL